MNSSNHETFANIDLDPSLSSDEEDKVVDPELAAEDQESAFRPKRTKRFIILVAVCAALGGLIFGYDIAGAGATFVMDSFAFQFGWKCHKYDFDCEAKSPGEIARDQGLINGLFGVGATIGAIFAPWVADSYGRRKALGLANLTFIFGAALQTFSPTMQVMWAGRVFSGLGIGELSMCVPVYIAELAPEHVRGQLSTLWQLAITIGILIASAANLGLQHWQEGWRLSYGGNIIFAIIFLGALCFMPESPRWLAGHGDDARAREAMSKIRFDDEIENEMKELKLECAEEAKLGVASWREVFATENKMRYRLVLGMLLQTFQQLSGINAIMFYAPTILVNFFGNDEAIIGTFILNFINFGATFICFYAVERFGRVKLLVSGGIIMALALIANAILAGVQQSRAVGWIVIVFAGIFIIGFAYSWGPVVWVVCAEFFPVRARGKATGLTTMSNWIMTTIVGACFPAAQQASLSGCFGFFAAVISIGTATVYFYQAETANKNILEIDETYAKHQPKLVRKQW